MAVAAAAITTSKLPSKSRGSPVMKANQSEFWRGADRQYSDLGMQLYWVVVTIISVTLLAATIDVATPRDAAELAAAQATFQR
jgi:hypothetical protein